MGLIPDITRSAGSPCLRKYRCWTFLHIKTGKQQPPARQGGEAGGRGGRRAADSRASGSPGDAPARAQERGPACCLRASRDTRCEHSPNVTRNRNQVKSGPPTGAQQANATHSASVAPGRARTASRPTESVLSAAVSSLHPTLAHTCNTICRPSNRPRKMPLSLLSCPIVHRRTRNLNDVSYGYTTVLHCSRKCHLRGPWF